MRCPHVADLAGKKFGIRTQACREREAICKPTQRVATLSHEGSQSRLSGINPD